MVEYSKLNVRAFLTDGHSRRHGSTGIKRAALLSPVVAQKRLSLGHGDAAAIKVTDQVLDFHFGQRESGNGGGCRSSADLLPARPAQHFVRAFRVTVAGH